MAKKKLLSEAQVHRFMGLAGIQPINEMGYHSPAKKDDEELEVSDDVEMDMSDGAELEVSDEVEMSDDAEMSDEMEMAPEEEVSIDSATIEKAREGLEALDTLLAALGGEEADEEAEEEIEDMDAMEDDEVAMDAMEDEEEPVLEGVEVQLSQTEIVNEVARRVAKRIVEAKKAQQKMNEALGRRTPSKRRRKK